MVAIKNMDMPKNCGECKCGRMEEESGFYSCPLINKYFNPFDFEDDYNLNNNRDIDCPLVEIKVESEV